MLCYYRILYVQNNFCQLPLYFSKICISLYKPSFFCFRISKTLNVSSVLFPANQSITKSSSTSFSRRSFSSTEDAKLLDKSSVQTPKHTVHLMTINLHTFQNKCNTFACSCVFSVIYWVILSNQVRDENGQDVTPQTFLQGDPAVSQPKQGKLFTTHDTSWGTTTDFLSVAFQTNASIGAPFTRLFSKIDVFLYILCISI